MEDIVAKTPTWVTGISLGLHLRRRREKRLTVADYLHGAAGRLTPDPMVRSARAAPSCRGANARQLLEPLRCIGHCIWREESRAEAICMIQSRIGRGPFVRDRPQSYPWNWH